MNVLVFAPHSAVWIHAFPEALVAEALMQEGHQITYVGCGGVLKSHCIAMSASGVPFEASVRTKAAICHRCQANCSIIRRRFGFDGVDLVDTVNEDDLSMARKLAAGVTPKNCLDFSLDGIEIGRIALYEVLLQNKKGTLDFSAAEWQRYQASLENTIVVLRCAQRILDNTRPDRIFLYNALYSVNRVVCRLAALRGIPQYFLHAGDNLSSRLQTLILARDHAYLHCQDLRHKWPDFKDRPCTTAAMSSATDHFLEVIKGRSIWAYSTAAGSRADLRQLFSIREDQKIICATMSSDDEVFAAEIAGTLPSDFQPLFKTQVDWIRALVAYVTPRPELSLIVRVHPREFPNKREGVLSEHARMLQVALSRLPDNVKVNWPTENISLYDLANVADVFVNAWSSAGKEMAWLGLPVVLYTTELTLYPASLNYVGLTEDDYFSKIEEALRDGWSADRIRETYRWCGIEYYYSLLSISESFSRNEVRSRWSRGLSRAMRTIAPTRQQDSDCRRRAPRLSSSGKIAQVVQYQLNSILDLHEQDPPISDSEETESLKREVGRLADGLYGTSGDVPRTSLARKLRSFASSKGQS
jgi:hypothetical protein